jgi:transcriptional regulator with XRE-family HTH domain
MTITKTNIAKTLKDFRAANNLTQAALAERLGCSIGWVGNIERGTQTPSEEMIGKLTKLVGRTRKTTGVRRRAA